MEPVVGTHVDDPQGLREGGSKQLKPWLKKACLEKAGFAQCFEGGPYTGLWWGSKSEEGRECEQR